MIKDIKKKSIKWWFGTMFFVLLFAIIGIFSYEKMSFLVNGVKIEANVERNTNSSITRITGKAPKATSITLNGREIFVDKEGNFSEDVSVLPGFSIITLLAHDKFGKEAQKEFEIVYDGNAPAIAFNNNDIIN